MFDNVKMVQSILDSIGAKHGVEAPRFDVSGFCMLGDESAPVRLQIFEERNQLVFTSPIALVPSMEREAIFEKMLSLNYFWGGTAGATIAYDGEADELVVQYAQSVNDLDEETFSKILENFSTLCDMMRADFGEFVKSLAESDDDDDDGENIFESGSNISMMRA